MDGGSSVSIFKFSVSFNVNKHRILFHGYFTVWILTIKIRIRIRKIIICCVRLIFLLYLSVLFLNYDYYNHKIVKLGLNSFIDTGLHV